MKFAVDLSKGVLGNADSTELWTDIISHIPDSVLLTPNVRILSVACGHCTEAVIIAKRMLALGISKETVRNSVWLIDKYRVFTNQAKSTHGFTNVITADFMEWEIDMKFDVIVGNPPYQRTDNKAKRWTLWEEFIKKSLGIADIVAMVVPQSLTSPNASFESIKDKCAVLNINVSKYFNVGSTFCYFIADNRQKITTTKIITDKKEYIRDISNLPFLPMNITDQSLQQLDDLIARPKRVWKRGELHTSNANLFSINGQYPVMHTNAQSLKSNIEHKNKTKIRVAVSLSGYPTFRVLQNEYATQACFWTEFSNLADAQTFADECNGTDIQELLKIFKWSGWNSKEVIQCL